MSDTAVDGRTRRGATPQMRRTIAGACAGTIIEWFDYGSYAYVAGTIAVVFFAGGDPALAVIQSWGLFALSFLIRPLGGLFWGYVGDRIGRARTLSITIIGTGLTTTVIGLLPVYSVVGFWAPILLLVARLCQGFCASGEYAGAAVLVGEHAPPGRRARYVSFIAIGNSAGFMLASISVTVLQAVLDTAAMQSWGWRVPFLLSAPLTLVGWYIRRKIDETPAFAEVRNGTVQSAPPLLAGFSAHWKTFLRLLFVMGINAGAYYLVLAYMASYLQEEVQLSAFQSNLIVTIALLVYLPTLYCLARLSDRIGRKPVLIANTLLFLVFSFPSFLVLDHGGFAVALTVQILMTSMFAFSDSTFATFFVESFPVNVRFTGFASLFNFGVAIFAGTTPLLSSWLIGRTGIAASPAFIVMVLAAACLIALLLSPETAPGKRVR
ncbi:MFS transporter [Amycolatopsis sp. WGS_07]|uniref:MFS transporter n=1 Tax=Amycolatopsis sp. WGS_07 TaxID=3076764 RepID=UPI003873C3BF